MRRSATYELGSRERSAFLDGIRGIAITLVVLADVAFISRFAFVSRRSQFVLLLGRWGLLLFFVLSGFLAYRPFAASHAGKGPPVGLREYGRRRLMRIVPAYWVALTTLTALGLIERSYLRDWWIHFGLLQSIWSRTRMTGLISSWPVSVLVLLYGALPVYARLAARLARRDPLRGELRAMALTAVATVALYAVTAASGRVGFPFVLFISGGPPAFATGMLIAVLAVHGCPPGAVKAWRAATDRPLVSFWAPAVALYLGAALLHDPRTPTSTWAAEAIRNGRDVLLVLSCSLIVLAGTREGDGGLARTVLAARPAAWIGRTAYGAYLWHYPLLVLVWREIDVRHVMSGTPTAALALTAIPIAIVTGTVSYLLVELPYVRLSSLSRGRRAA